MTALEMHVCQDANMHVCHLTSHFCINNQHIQYRLGGTVALWLVRLYPE